MPLTSSARQIYLSKRTRRAGGRRFRAGRTTDLAMRALESRTASSFSIDAEFIDERPPLLGTGLHKCPECFRRQTQRSAISMMSFGVPLGAKNPHQLESAVRAGKPLFRDQPENAGLRGARRGNESWRFKNRA